MRQEGLVMVTPIQAPAQKYKRQVTTFSTSSAFVIRSELRRRHLIAIVFAASFLLLTALGPFVLNEAIGTQ